MVLLRIVSLTGLIAVLGAVVGALLGVRSQVSAYLMAGMLGLVAIASVKFIVSCYFLTFNMIKLDQFLKFVGIASTGGQAKLMINDGDVKVNGMIETRRGRKLVSADQVTVAGKTFKVEEIIQE